MSFDPATLVQPTHDEFSRQRFVLGLKTFIAGDLTPGNKVAMNGRVIPAFQRAKGHAPRTRQELRQAMLKDPYHQYWSALMRTGQEFMWEAVEDPVDRQLPVLAKLAAQGGKNRGGLRLDPAFRPPRYITSVDHHGMPGSYHGEVMVNDMRAGAVFDAGANLYHLGYRGPHTDLMGSTLVAFVRGEYPSLAPKRILDEGCTIGHSTVPLVRYFPRAEVHTIGVGAPILRYAHARAESMGVAIHFSLQSAERTDFPDNHFDLVVSHIMLHETSAKAVPTIMRECHRILRPGGVMAHMDVPVRYRDLPIYDQVIRSWQTYYNDQPFWDAVCSMDLEAAARQGGFKKIKAGYLRASSDPIKEPRTLSPTGDQGPAWRYIVSAVK